MGKREPNYRRAFWVTATIVGVLNVAFSVHVWSCPEKPIGKGGKLKKEISDWAMPVAAIDLPGWVFTTPFWFGRLGTMPDSEMDLLVCTTQVISTIFWAVVAVGVEWFSFRNRTTLANPPAPQRYMHLDDRELADAQDLIE